MEELSSPNKNPEKGQLRGGATEVDGRPGKLTAQNKKSREGPHSSSGATEVDGHSGKKHKTGKNPRGPEHQGGAAKPHYPGAQPRQGKGQARASGRRDGNAAARGPWPANEK